MSLQRPARCPTSAGPSIDRSAPEQRVRSAGTAVRMPRTAAVTSRLSQDAAFGRFPFPSRGETSAEARQHSFYAAPRLLRTLRSRAPGPFLTPRCFIATRPPLVRKNHCCRWAGGDLISIARLTSRNHCPWRIASNTLTIARAPANFEPPAAKAIAARATCVSRIVMTDARPAPPFASVRHRCSRYGVVGDHANVAPLSCLTLTCTSHCIALANIALDLRHRSAIVLGEPARKDKPFVVFPLTLRFSLTQESDGQPSRWHMSPPLLSAFRHWRDSPLRH